MARPKQKKHTARKVLLALLIVIVAGVCVCMALNAVANTKLMTYARSFEPLGYKEDRLRPERDPATGCVSFTTDEDFHVLQLSDIHVGGGFLSYQKDLKALTAVASMIAGEMPDLVIITGDVAYPVPFSSGTINNIRPVHALCTTLERLGVYWCVTYGNHDTELYSLANRAKISKIYSDRDAYPHCLFEVGPEDVDGYGNYAVNVKNSMGLITQTLYLIDSHSYTGMDYLGIFWNYDNIHKNQIDWYKAQLAKMNDANAKTIAGLNLSASEAANMKQQFGSVKSLLFFHIPLKEYQDAYQEYVKNGYSDTENVKLIYGTVGEKDEVICCSDHEDDLFETVLAEKSTQGIFCGHDHYNNFSIDYKGVRLTYGCSVDYLAYRTIAKTGSQRGCTPITVRPDGTFECHKENYYQAKYESSGSEAVTMQRLNPNMEN